MKPQTVIRSPESHENDGVFFDGFVLPKMFAD